ncbi:MAG: HlyD family efflux transporter periplasmic adaptor subunit, partial [Melioribacteraceae bacterium]|nr:HlyD family efflux transporter periplasmic adaptor subunit [Melioribacteraceae bacterium]
TYGPFQEFIPITGTVQPIETFFLDVAAGGRVVTKFVEEGAYLDIGDPIVKLDNAQLTLDIIYNEANVYQQLNNLRSTKLAFEQNKLSLRGQLLQMDYEIKNQTLDHEANKILFEKNLISKNEFEKSFHKIDYLIKKRDLTNEIYIQDSVARNAQIDQLEFSVKTLQNNLLITKQQLDNLTVKSPIKGQLTSLRAEIGQSINRGENLGQIDDITAFKVRAGIDEHYITRVNPGQKGTFTLANIDYELIIKTVYPEVSAGRFQVDLIFEGVAPQGIRRGQSLQIKLELGDLSNRLLVNRGGFYQTTGGQWIFVVDETGNSATRVDIKLGRQNPQAFELLEGLMEGEKVITSSYDNYRDVEKLVIN